MKSLTNSCIKYAKAKGVEFSYKGRKLSCEEVFADFGILPGILKRASKLSSVCIGSSFGESYPKKEKSYLGYSVTLSESHLSLPLMMLFVVDVLEIVIGSKSKGDEVRLDEFARE